MTFEQLRIFVAVAERRHMTRAAEALGLTQSAVSAAIAALEARYGTKLFDRIGRGVELSAAGAEFLPEAKAVLDRAAIAAGALEDLTGLRRGRLVLAASQTVASYWLPGRLARFAAAHPGITLQLVTGNTAGAAEAVRSGVADLGFVEGETEVAVLDRMLIARDQINLYAAPDHPLARSPHAPTDDELRAAAWVLRETGSGTRAHFERALASRDLALADLAVRLELPSNEAVLAAVSTGGLVTAVSDLAAAPLLAAGRLARIAFHAPDRAFALLTHRQRNRSRAAAAFVAELDLAES
ncbi:MAG: LysR family transcriptional regulator, partial [Proteobacteria bacterium]|nr:LysR family transcriptional regulator [Pseudomonadota bacterium]